MQELNILAKNCQKIVLFLCSRNISNKEKIMQFFQVSNLNTLLYLTKKNEFVPTLIYNNRNIYFLVLLDKERNLIKKENWFAELQDCFFLVRNLVERDKTKYCLLPRQVFFRANKFKQKEDFKNVKANKNNHCPFNQKQKEMQKDQK